MDNISINLNEKLKKYIDDFILPMYLKNDLGHNLEHVNYVISRSFEIVKKLKKTRILI